MAAQYPLRSRSPASLSSAGMLGLLPPQNGRRDRELALIQPSAKIHSVGGGRLGMGRLFSKTSPFGVLYLPPLVPKQPTPLPPLSTFPTIYFGSLNLINNRVGVPYLIIIKKRRRKKIQKNKNKNRGIITSKRTKIKNPYSDAGSHSAIFYFFFFPCLFKSI